MLLVSIFQVTGLAISPFGSHSPLVLILNYLLLCHILAVSLERSRYLCRSIFWKWKWVALLDRWQRLGTKLKGLGAEVPPRGPGAEPPEPKTWQILHLRESSLWMHCMSLLLFLVYRHVWFSRISHKNWLSVFTELVSHPRGPTTMFRTSHRICVNFRIESRAGWGAAAPLPPPQGWKKPRFLEKVFRFLIFFRFF